MKKLGLGLLVILFSLFAFTSCDDSVDELNSDAIEDTTLDPGDGGEEIEDDVLNSGGG